MKNAKSTSSYSKCILFYSSGSAEALIKNLFIQRKVAERIRFHSVPLQTKFIVTNKIRWQSLSRIWKFLVFGDGKQIIFNGIPMLAVGVNTAINITDVNKSVFVPCIANPKQCNAVCLFVVIMVRPLICWGKYLYMFAISRSNYIRKFLIMLKFS